MDVQCEKCGTEYALDETLVGPTGTAVRCTSCGHVFKVFPKSAPAAGRETWMLRQASGATFPFDRLGVLQDWISAGKVSEDDLIAKSGGEWKRLGDIAEMRPFFDAIKPSKQSMPAPSAVSAGYPGTTPSELAATIRAPAGGVSPSTPAPRPSSTGPTTAEYGLPRADQFGDTQLAAPMARPVSTVQPGAPTVQAQAPTVRAQYPPTGVPGHTLETAATQPQISAPQQPPPSAQPADAAMAPTRPLKPVPESIPPGPAAQAGYYDPTDSAATVALSADDPRYAKAMSQPPHQTHEAPTVMGEPDFSASQIPSAAEDRRWEQGAGAHAAGPAWAERGAALPDDYADDYADDRPAPRRKIGRWIALVIIVLLVGGGFYMFMFQRPLVDELLSGLTSGQDAERHEKFFVKGRENFLLDTFPAFKQADREYQKVLALRETDAPTLAALAEMYAVWAQYLRDTALDARADALASATDGAEPDLREVERFESEIEEKLAEATRWAEQALQADPELAAAHLAMADVKRLAGDLDEARNELERARGAEADPAADYVAALIAIDEERAAADASKALERVLQLEELLRALYRRGRALAAEGDTGGAKQALARLTELNSQHGLARDLADRITAGKPVFLTRKSLEARLAEQAAPVADAGPAPEEPPPPAQPTQPVKVAGAGGEGAAVPAGGSPDAMLARAARMQETGNTAGAMSLFKKVLDVQPSNIDALCGLAYCYLDNGNKGQAIAHFRRALGVNGTYGPAIIGLANTYKSQGNTAEALKWYKKYLEVRPGGRHAALARTNIERLEGAGGGDKPTADTGGDQGDKPAGGTGDKPAGGSSTNPYDEPAGEGGSGGSGAPQPPPASAPPSDPPTEEQPPATEG